MKCFLGRDRHLPVTLENTLPLEVRDWLQGGRSSVLYDHSRFSYEGYLFTRKKIMSSKNIYDLCASYRK